MSRRQPKADATRVPEAERAFLAGLLELLTDKPARCREAVQLVEPAALTIEGGPELLNAVAEAAALEAPTLADVLRIAREQPTVPAAAGVEPERVLLADLVKASAGNPGGYARGVNRHAREITKAAARRRTIEAARAAEAVAADPGAGAEEIEAAARGVAEASAELPLERLDWEPFPVELLPDPVGTFVAETAAGLGTDATFVALPLLASVAAVIGNRRRIELWNGWQEPSILWAVSVAESGSMKSPAASAALRFLRERQRAAFAEHRAALADWEREKQAHESAKRSRSAEAEPLEGKPTAERFIADDVTIEAVAPILDANPRGVLLDRDELSGWIEGFDRYAGGRAGGEVARWLTIYDGGPITVDRKLSGTIFVPAALVSITGGVQPAVLSRVAGSRHFENGLVPRFIVAAPPRRQMTIPKGGAGFATVAAMEQMFSTLVALPAGQDGPTVLDLEPEARELFEDSWRELAAEWFQTTGPVAAMLSKARAWAARLALVTHSIRQSGSEPQLGHRIDSESMRRGVGLARWAAHEWRRVFEGLQRGSIEQHDRALREWIAGRGGVASARDVARGLAQYRGPGRAEAALQRLARSGAAEWITPQTGGRPADAVRLK